MVLINDTYLQEYGSNTVSPNSPNRTETLSPGIFNDENLPDGFSGFTDSGIRHCRTRGADAPGTALICARRADAEGTEREGNPHAAQPQTGAVL